MGCEHGENLPDVNKTKHPKKGEGKCSNGGPKSRQKNEITNSGAQGERIEFLTPPPPSFRKKHMR
jgi:hypothetical protein